MGRSISKKNFNIGNLSVNDLKELEILHRLYQLDRDYNRSFEILIKMKTLTIDENIARKTNYVRRLKKAANGNNAKSGGP